MYNFWISTDYKNLTNMNYEYANVLWKRNEDYKEQIIYSGLG